MTSANNTGILSEKLKLIDSEMLKNIRLGPILNLKKKEIKMFPYFLRRDLSSLCGDVTKTEKLFHI